MRWYSVGASDVAIHGGGIFGGASACFIYHSGSGVALLRRTRRPVLWHLASLGPWTPPSWAWICAQGKGDLALRYRRGVHVRGTLGDKPLTRGRVWVHECVFVNQHSSLVFFFFTESCFWEVVLPSDLGRFYNFQPVMVWISHVFFWP